MAEWTEEWPRERGWYWFYGQTSTLMHDSSPEMIATQVWKVQNGYTYVANGRFLYKAEGARGLWTPMTLPEPPTDSQIEEVLDG